MQFLATMTGYSLINNLALFLAKNVSGVLEVKEKGFLAKIWLKDGKILFATNNNGITLKEAIISLNLLSSSEQDELLNLPDDSELDLLVTQEELLPEKIITYIRSHQTAETLYSIIELEKVTYCLQENDSLKVGREDLLINNDWLTELSHNRHGWMQIRSIIDGNIREVSTKPLRNNTLSKDEEKIYSLCQGKKNLKEIVLKSLTSYYKAYSIIIGLITKNLLDYQEKEPGELDNHFVHEVVKILDNIEQLPGIKKAFVVDRDGSVIAKDSQENQSNSGNSTEKMALIFANTVTNFETNLVNSEEEGELIEQLLVERSNGEKTLLVVSGKFIMVTEALSDCDWGLVRLSAQKSMKSIRQLTANAS